MSSTRLSRESGRTVDQVAQDLGVGKSTLTAWRRQLRDAAPPKQFDDPKKEIARLQRELETVQQERDLLKGGGPFAEQTQPMNATAFFAKETVR